MRHKLLFLTLFLSVLFILLYVCMGDAAKDRMSTHSQSSAKGASAGNKLHDKASGVTGRLIFNFTAKCTIGIVLINLQAFTIAAGGCV